jgi:transposase InsO family protein
LAKGFLYLVEIMDWWSGKVLAWRLSNIMDVQFCVDVLDEALARMVDRRSSIPTRVASSRRGHGRSG